MHKVSERIKALLDKKGISNAELARSIGISRSAVTRWFTSDIEPKGSTVTAIAEYMGVPTTYFYEGKLTTEDKENIEHLIEVSAGKGRINDCYERVSDSVEVNICGDSMYPVLQDGDVVRVVPATNTVPTDLTVVKINGDECTVKYVELTETGIWLRAENKAVFEDRFYTVQKCLTLPVQIIGKAVEITSRIL